MAGPKTDATGRIVQGEVHRGDPPFSAEVPPAEPRSAMEIATTAAAQEVQAAFLIAKRFPRDEQLAWQRIQKACSRRTLAEQATYAYPRGGQTVTGPSIRLAEVLAQNWGNFKSGVMELERRKGESVAMAFAADLETNTWDTKVFQVRHWRDTKQGGYPVTDERDIYEIVANQGARRKRACILALIPGDVQDAALVECDKTLRGQSKDPIADRCRKMVVAFGELGVTIPMLEGRLGHKLDAITEREMVGLQKIYTSIRDEMSTREQWFDLKGGKPKDAAEVEAASEKGAQDAQGPVLEEQKAVLEMLLAAKLPKSDQTVLSKSEREVLVKALNAKQTRGDWDAELSSYTRAVNLRLKQMGGEPLDIPLYREEA